MSKYKCRECKIYFTWLEDFINHMKEKHPNSRPLVYTTIWGGKSLTDLRKTLLKETG